MYLGTIPYSEPRHGVVVVSTVTSQQEGPAFESGLRPFRVGFA